MTFEQIRLLELFLLPPGGLILLALLGVVLIFTRLGRVLAFFAVIGIYLLSTPYLSSWLNHQLEKQHAAIDPITLERLQPPLEALVVLGGGYYGESIEYADTAIGPFFAERLRYAAWLSKQTALPVIVSSGKPDTPAAIRILVNEFGIENVIAEDASWTTDDNVRNVSDLMRRLDIERIGVITHGWHMPRAMWSFQSLSIDATAIPMGLLSVRPSVDRLTNWLPSMIALMRSRNAMHEYLGLLWYQIADLTHSSKPELALR